MNRRCLSKLFPSVFNDNWSHEIDITQAELSHLQNAETMHESLRNDQVHGGNALTQHLQEFQTSFPTAHLENLLPMSEMGDHSFGFDLTLSSDDILNVLQRDSTLAPFSAMPGFSPEARSNIVDDSIHGVPTRSGGEAEDASRHAVESMWKIIRDLPRKLLADPHENETPDFFEDCLELCFARFLTTFPIIHKPSFSAKDCTSSLLLNILAIGSCFVGSERAGLRVSHAFIKTSYFAVYEAVAHCTKAGANERLHRENICGH